MFTVGRGLILASSDGRRFDLKDYKGVILTDLFGDNEYFADPDKFWTLQNTKIAKAMTEYESEGWQVELMERGRGFDSIGSMIRCVSLFWLQSVKCKQSFTIQTQKL